ncbi:MAG TPA: 50S ribosomal protein L11 methyltransferase [Candidatus Kapabacteria bacterium]|jgi:ribosomal protein L11 methyltransferase
MASLALQFDVPDEDRDKLEGFFLMRTPLEGILENDDGSLTFFIPEQNWNDLIASEVRSRFPHTEFLEAILYEEKNWNAEWEASIEPIQVTPDLLIAPSWKKEEAQAMGSKYLLIVDPKMSFGTGHHETTRLCLQAMESLRLHNRKVLDLGTGSGILALYALERGAKKVLAIDTDTWSIQNARENRAINKRSDPEFEIRMGTIERVRPQEMLGVLFANIHRNVLLEIPADLFAHAAARAHLVLSGILEYDAKEIQTAYEKAGFTFQREWKENEWSCLVFQRVA